MNDKEQIKTLNSLIIGKGEMKIMTPLRVAYAEGFNNSIREAIKYLKGLIKQEKQRRCIDQRT